MEHLISTNYPESLAFSLKMGDQEFKREMKIISLIKLYELGKKSSGLAAKLLDMKCVNFLVLLEKYNISYFFKGLENELNQISQMRKIISNTTPILSLLKNKQTQPFTKFVRKNYYSNCSL